MSVVGTKGMFWPYIAGIAVILLLENSAAEGKSKLYFILILWNYFIEKVAKMSICELVNSAHHLKFCLTWSKANKRMLNTQAGDNFESFKVCMGKRDLAKAETLLKAFKTSTTKHLWLQLKKWRSF